MRRLLRWLDRRVLGFVMGTAAFVIERAVVRGMREDPEPTPRKVSVGS